MGKEMISARIQTAILFAAFILIMTVGTHPAYADSSHHHSTQVTNNYSSQASADGLSAAFSCGAIDFTPSNETQLGAALGGYDGILAPCVGIGVTGKNRSLYSGRLGVEEGKVGGAISGVWRFK